MSSLLCPGSTFPFCASRDDGPTPCTESLDFLSISVRAPALVPLSLLLAALLLVSAWRTFRVFGRNLAGLPEVVVLHATALLWLLTFFAEHCIFTDGAGLTTAAFLSCAAFVLLCVALAHVGTFLIVRRFCLHPHALLRWVGAAFLLAAGVALLVVGFFISPVLFDVALLAAFVVGIGTFAVGILAYAFLKCALTVYAAFLCFFLAALTAHTAIGAFFASDLCPRLWRFFAVDEFALLYVLCITFAFSAFFREVRSDMVGIRKLGEVDMDGQVFNVNIDPF